MGRKRIYANDAERQRAYRSREALSKPIPAPPIRQGPEDLEASRVAEIEKSVRDLIADCRVWLNELPGSIRASSHADSMANTLKMLDVGAELLAEIGRDAKPTP
jgi:hypothetical protein